jgi:hypothetical protein
LGSPVIGKGDNGATIRNCSFTMHTQFGKRW